MTREEAIKGFQDMKKGSYPFYPNEYFDMAIKALEQEPKTGHWVYIGEENEEETKAGNFRYVCSKCCCSDVHAKSFYVPYCWNCGAKMAESEDKE